MFASVWPRAWTKYVSGGPSLFVCYSGKTHSEHEPNLHLLHDPHASLQDLFWRAPPPCPFSGLRKDETTVNQGRKKKKKKRSEDRGEKEHGSHPSPRLVSSLSPSLHSLVLSIFPCWKSDAGAPSPPSTLFPSPPPPPVPHAIVNGGDEKKEVGHTHPDPKALVDPWGTRLRPSLPGSFANSAVVESAASTPLLLPDRHAADKHGEARRQVSSASLFDLEGIHAPHQRRRKGEIVPTRTPHDLWPPPSPLGDAQEIGRVAVPAAAPHRSHC